MSIRLRRKHRSMSIRLMHICKLNVNPSSVKRSRASLDIRPDPRRWICVRIHRGGSAAESTAGDLRPDPPRWTSAFVHPGIGFLGRKSWTHRICHYLRPVEDRFIFDASKIEPPSSTHRICASLRRIGFPRIFDASDLGEYPTRWMRQNIRRDSNNIPVPSDLRRIEYARIFDASDFRESSMHRIWTDIRRVGNSRIFDGTENI